MCVCVVSVVVDATNEIGVSSRRTRVCCALAIEPLWYSFVLPFSCRNDPPRTSLLIRWLLLLVSIYIYICLWVVVECLCAPDKDIAIARSIHRAREGVLASSFK
jgi:hypothetical protein